MTICVPLGWTPTAENINTLPNPVKQYIHDLETNADPAGTIQDLALLKDQTKQLDAMIARLKKVINRTCDVYTDDHTGFEIARKMYEIIGEEATDG
jgi:hypothetical protein